MVKNELNDYKYPLAVISIAVVIATVLILFIGRPLFVGMQNKRAELAAKQEQKTALVEKLETLKNLKSREEEIKEKNARVLAALPSDKDVSRLFVQFERAAASNGLSVTRVSESTTAASAPSSAVIKNLVYEVSGDAGSYLSLKSSLEKFQTALRILSVDAIDVTGSQNGLTVKLNVLTYTRGS